eukprot:COSAG05_NODE_1879_length_3911_cov_4.160283_4_plen_122_part_00
MLGYATAELIDMLVFIHGEALKQAERVKELQKDLGIGTPLGFARSLSKAAGVTSAEMTAAEKAEKEVILDPRLCFREQIPALVVLSGVVVVAVNVVVIKLMMLLSMLLSVMSSSSSSSSLR